MMNNNEIIINIISRYLVGDITDDEQKYLDHWIGENVENSKFFKHITSTEYVKRKIERNKSFDYEDALNEFMEKKNRKRKKQTIRLLAFVSGVAAVIVVMFLWNANKASDEKIIVTEQEEKDVISPMLKLSNGNVVTFSSVSTNDTIRDANTIISINGSSIEYLKTKQTEEELRYNELIVPNKCICPLTLSDGTKVWVNANSSIKFPVTFPNKNRVVYVTGEVFFDVMKENSRPFKVITNRVEIEVTGTIFNVNDYDEQNDIEITLVEGGIRASTNGIGYEVKPNEQLVINKASEKVDILQVAASDYTQWRNGLYVFHKKEIHDIMHIIERQWGIKCILKNPEDGEMCITGVMNVNDGLYSFIKLLSRSSNLTCEIKDETIVIK